MKPCVIFCFRHPVRAVTLWTVEFVTVLFCSVGVIDLDLFRNAKNRSFSEEPGQCINFVLLEGYGCLHLYNYYSHSLMIVESYLKN